MLTLRASVIYNSLLVSMRISLPCLFKNLKYVVICINLVAQQLLKYQQQNEHAQKHALPMPIITPRGAIT